MTPCETATANASPSPEWGKARRIVVKIGSALLVERETGRLRATWLNSLIDDVAELSAKGRDIILVSSGAIALGRHLLGLPKGALVSHRNLEANAWNQAIADGSRSEDVNLVATPLYHMGAVFMAVTYMLFGCTQVVLAQFSAGAWLATRQSRPGSCRRYDRRACCRSVRYRCNACCRACAV